VDPGVYLFIYSPADLRIQLVFADFSVGKKREKGYHPFCSFENEVPYQSLKSELMCRVVDLAHEFERKKSQLISSRITWNPSPSHLCKSTRWWSSMYAPLNK
jgi:hypothetical protein